MLLKYESLNIKGSPFFNIYSLKKTFHFFVSIGEVDGSKSIFRENGGFSEKLKILRLKNLYFKKILNVFSGVRVSFERGVMPRCQEEKVGQLSIDTANGSSFDSATALLEMSVR